MSAVMASADSGRIGRAPMLLCTGGSGREDEKGLITALDNNKKHYVHQKQGNTVHVACRKILL